jgi:hypothetical protein
MTPLYDDFQELDFGCNFFSFYVISLSVQCNLLPMQCYNTCLTFERGGVVFEGNIVGDTPTVKNILLINKSRKLYT